MKKAIVSVLVLSVLLLAGCTTTTDLTTNKVGWSNYADLSVKDYDVVGIINVESQEVYECGPLGFNKSLKGSRITWSDLMAEAVKLGADDVIVIRGGGTGEAETDKASKEQDMVVGHPEANIKAPVKVQAEFPPEFDFRPRKQGEEEFFVFFVYQRQFQQGLDTDAEVHRGRRFPLV